jgi:hypothetical protein
MVENRQVIWPSERFASFKTPPPLAMRLHCFALPILLHYEYQLDNDFTRRANACASAWRKDLFQAISDQI